MVDKRFSAFKGLRQISAAVGYPSLHIKICVVSYQLRPFKGLDFLRGLRHPL